MSSSINLKKFQGLAAGRVYLVGAGPGDPGLLTIKARDLLSLCDVVLYDGLVTDAILALANPAVEFINVSKRAGSEALTQAEINQRLIDQARRGRQVVRLKGGDPFVFGRGAEEAQALTAAGIEWEVVPGVSAGLGAAAYAGVPLTHRTLASSVAFVTGQEDPHKDNSRVDWAQLATAVDTIVVFMGLKQLPQIAAKLIESGRSNTTPVAVIERGTQPVQRTITGTLETIAAHVTELESPALIVIGEVVELRQALNWFEPRLRQTTPIAEFATVALPGQELPAQPWLGLENLSQ